MASRRCSGLTAKTVITMVVCLLFGTTVFADGVLPPRPYRYLHPPHGLGRTNRVPLPGERAVPAKGGRNTSGFTLFTKDGQAALGANARSLVVSQRDKSMLISVHAVNPPSPLPRQYQVDGNAYSMSVVGKPDGKGARVTQRLGIVLRWPLVPHAILMYSAKRWRVVCDVSSRDWQINPLIVYCHAPALGTFIAARRVYG